MNKINEIADRIISPKYLSGSEWGIGNRYQSFYEIEIDNEKYAVLFDLIPTKNKSYFKLKIDFSVHEIGSKYGYRTTGKNTPLLVMSNIIGVIKKYLSRKNLSNVILDGFIIKSKSDVKGDTRRFDIYNYYLKKYFGKIGLNIIKEISRESKDFSKNNFILTKYIIEPTRIGNMIIENNIKTFEEYNWFRRKKEEPSSKEYWGFKLITSNLIDYINNERGEGFQRRDSFELVIEYFEKFLIGKRIKIKSSKLIKPYKFIKKGKVKNGKIKNGIWDFVLTKIEKSENFDRFTILYDKDNIKYFTLIEGLANCMVWARQKRRVTEIDPYGEEDWGENEFELESIFRNIKMTFKN